MYKLSALAVIAPHTLAHPSCEHHRFQFTPRDVYMFVFAVCRTRLLRGRVEFANASCFRLSDAGLISGREPAGSRFHDACLEGQRIRAVDDVVRGE